MELRLRNKIHIPYTSLQSHVTRLQRLQQAGDVLRRTARFVVLARRLESQVRDMKKDGTDPTIKRESRSNSVDVTTLEDDGKERTIAKAALSIAELGELHLSMSNRNSHTVKRNPVALLDDPNTEEVDPEDAAGTVSEDRDTNYIPLRFINAVAEHVPLVEEARTNVTAEMQTMVLTGLSTLVSQPPAQSLILVLNEMLSESAPPINITTDSFKSPHFTVPRAKPRVRSFRSCRGTHKKRIRPKQGWQRYRPQRYALSRRIDIKTPSHANSDHSFFSILFVESSSPSQSLLYKSRVRTEPTSVTAPQWTAALWGRLDNLIEEMAGCCIKVCVHGLFFRDWRFSGASVIHNRCTRLSRFSR